MTAIYLLEKTSVNHAMLDRYRSGQIIATSHDLTPNDGLVFQGNPGW